MEYASNSEAATSNIASNFANSMHQNHVVFLTGALGSGKSVFARALIQTLCGDNNLIVPSPTYTLVERYETPLGALHHFDLYRLKSPDEIYEIGWDEMINQSLCVIEWPERLDGLYRGKHTHINIMKCENGMRTITIQNIDKQ